MTANVFGVPARPPASELVASPATIPAEPRKTGFYRLALWLWLVYMFEPQTYIANQFHIPAVGKLLLILTCLVAVALVMKPPRRAFLLPYAAIAAYIFGVSFIAINTGYARIPATQAAFLYVLALGLASYVKTPKQVLPIVTAFMVGQFLWWGLWGVQSGLIRWHGEYSNYDGFGPLMDFGVAAAFPYGVATRNKRTRMIAFGIGLLCVIGLVSTFARGAFVAAVAVLGWMWLNAPRKGVATGFLVAAGLVLLLAAQLFNGAIREDGVPVNFFDEMGTIFKGSGDESEADNSNGRGALWDAAWKVTKEHPLLGVGGRNCGVYASTHFTAGEVGGMFRDNPAMMYDAALHNMFYQILCEYGVVGLGLYCWLFLDFFRRNHKLRSPAFRAAWVARGGGALDLKWISIGLTGMMIAVLANGWFYNVLHLVFLPTVVMVNALLYNLSRPGNSQARQGFRPAYR